MGGSFNNSLNTLEKEIILCPSFPTPIYYHTSFTRRLSQELWLEDCSLVIYLFFACHSLQVLAAVEGAPRVQRPGIESKSNVMVMEKIKWKMHCWESLKRVQNLLSKWGLCMPPVPFLGTTVKLLACCSIQLKVE